MQSSSLSCLDYVKSLTPLEIKNYNTKNLISLINGNYQIFFDNINIDALKAVNNEVFKYLSKDSLKSLSIEKIELLVKIEKIGFLPDFFLNIINKEILKNISDNFYGQLQTNHIENAKKDILKQIVIHEKLNLLNDTLFESFCKTVSFETLEKNSIFSVLKELKRRNNFKYLTSNNFLALEKCINEPEIEIYLKDLKSISYSDKKNELEFELKYKNKYNESLLTENDIKNEEIVINYDEIEYKIEEYINEEKYDLLRIYCNKCSRNVKNNEKMLSSLNSLLNHSKNNIYDLIDEYEIRKMLILLNPQNTDNIKHFKRLKQIIIRDLQIVEPKEIDEFMTKILKYSEIVNGKSFDIDLREILAEENLKFMKYMKEKYYNGEEQNAAPNNLKKIYVRIINDYMNVIKEKYNIDREKIFNGLQNIDRENKGNKERKEIEVTLFENSLNKYEKLYYDLLLQSILEMPDSESWIESVCTPIFKIIRDIVLAFGSFKLASLTGSKIILALSASVGGITIFKDLSQEMIKTYFFFDDKQRTLYHLNQKNSPKRRFSILIKKIKEKYWKIFKPLKNIFTKFVDTKILHLKEAPKIGFEKMLKKEENIEIECEIFRNNELKHYFKNKKEMKKIEFQQNLFNIQKKYEKRNKSKPSKINKFFKLRRKIVSKYAEFKEKKLKEKYPGYKDPTIFEKIKKLSKKIKGFGYGGIKSFCNIFTFGLTTKYFAKKNSFENTLEMIKNKKYNEFKKKLEDIQKKKEDDNYIILYEEIKYLTRASPNDSYLFKTLEDNNSKEMREIDEEIVHLKYKNISKSKNKPILKPEIKDDSENLNENSYLNIRLLDNEESEIDDNVISTQSY